MSVVSASLPFAALSVGDARALFREIIAEELGRFNLQPVGVPTAKPDVLDISGVQHFLSSAGLSIPRSAIYKATASNELMHEKFGRRLLFTEDAVLQWIMSRISTPETKSDAALRLAADARKKGRKISKQPKTTKNNPNEK